MATRTELIADLLMGAAHADTSQTVAPYDLVCVALKQVMGAAYILSAVDERLRGFDAGSFDMVATLGQLGLDDPTEKRQLLELIASLHDADATLALDRDAYLRSVAEALGVAEDEYDDLTIDVEDARDSLFEDRVSLFEARDSLFGPAPSTSR